MILFFSGTGNSEYVARKVGRKLNEHVLDLFQKIKEHDFKELKSEKPWIIIAPTYAWRIPRILQEWLEHTQLSGNKDIYFIMTCGGNIGNAGKYLRELCSAKNMRYLGCASIVMPENYIAMFSTPTKEEALQIIHKADQEIHKTIEIIKSGRRFQEAPITVKDKLNSGVVNDVFYPLFVHAKKFYTKDTCVSCGKCANVCPLGNIQMKHGRPIWGKNCTHCMACICRCPSEAIEYGAHSKGMVRYVCPDRS